MQVSFTFVQFVFQWNLVCDRDYVKSLIMTFQMVGVLIGAVIVGQLADMYGRRNIYFAVYTLLLIVSFGSSFASSWQLYAACRAIIGALIGGICPFCLLNARDGAMPVLSHILYIFFMYGAAMWRLSISWCIYA